MAIPTIGISTDINLYLTKSVVKKIKKKPILEPNSNLCAPDFTETLARNNIIPIVKIPEPMIYLNIAATSKAKSFSIIPGNIAIFICLLK